MVTLQPLGDLLAKRFGGLLIAVMLCFECRSAVAAGVVNDGSLGAAPVTRSGNIFTITPASGKLVGTNLFYSLSTLNLTSGQTANFTGPSSVQNVLTRVTGGQSTIDGTLECSIPAANFLLINSAGIVFGPDASLNVSGSFAVVTADQVKLADGHVFAAVPAVTDATLTTAPPAAFGFLSAHPASITVNGAVTIDQSGAAHLNPTLNPAPNGSLMVVGGNITVNGGELATTGTGSATIVSVASPGTVNLSNPTNTSSFSSMGAVSVTAGGLLGSDATNGGVVDSGPVTVAAGNVTVDGYDPTGTVSSMLGSFSGTGGIAGPVSVTATGSLIVSNSAELGSDAYFDSGTDSGMVTISAGSLMVIGANPPGTASSLLGSFAGSGNSGPVKVTVTGGGALVVNGSGDLSSSAVAGVDSGSLTVSAGSITLTGASADGTYSFLGSSAGTGNAGSVTITASGVLTISGGGTLTSDATFLPNSSTLTGKSSGVVTVSAPSVVIDGIDSLLGQPSTLGSVTGSTSGGSFNLTTQTLSITNGGQIFGTALGAGNGGAVNVNVSGPITLNGGSVTSFTGIGAQSVQTAPGGGRGGDITVTAGTLSILNGAEIDASTGGTGAGGNCTVSVSGALTLDKGSSGNANDIGAASQLTTPGGGPGGNVTVTAGTLSILNGAEITAASLGTAPAGNVTVSTAGQVALQSGSLLTVSSVSNDGGALSVSANGGFQLFDSNVTTSSGHNGGNITLSSPGIILLRDASVSAFAQHNGGNITIDPSLVVLDNSSLSANAVLGSGGAITIAASDGFLQSDSSITFSSTFGVQGSLTLLTPQLDVAGALIALPPASLGGMAQLIPACGHMVGDNVSSFVQIGNGGMAAEPGGLLPAFDPAEDIEGSTRSK
jgi:filamentous hemagglutinin family protein